MTEPRANRAADLVLPGACVAALGLVAWWFILRLPFTGIDSWPMLVQARNALADPSVLWRERYLEGLWDGARFWRPGVTLVSALEWLLFGDRPPGYHAARLVVAIATALLVGRAAALHGAAPRPAFAAAALVYLLHPVQAETLPVTARAADTLVTLLTVAGLVGLSGLRERGVATWSVLGAAALLCAPTLKESGLLAPVLGIVVLAPWRVRAPRWRTGLGIAGVLGAGLAAHIGYRWHLLGTIGRYERELPLDAQETLRELLAGLFDHQRWGVVPLATALIAALLWFGRDLQSGSDNDRWHDLRNACIAWALGGGAVFVTSAVFRLRYAEGLLAPLAIVCGAALSAILAATRGRKRLALAALWSATVLTCTFPGTPLLWRYPQWQLAGRTAETVLATAGEAVRAAESNGRASREVGRFTVTAARQGGGTVRVAIDPFPSQPAEPRAWNTGRTANIFILAPYAADGYFRLQGYAAGAVRVEPGIPLIGVSPADLGPAGSAIGGY